MAWWEGRISLNLTRTRARRRVCCVRGEKPPASPPSRLFRAIFYDFRVVPGSKSLLVRKGASSSLVVDTHAIEYVVHVAEWLRRQSKVFFAAFHDRKPGLPREIALEPPSVLDRARPTRPPLCRAGRVRLVERSATSTFTRGSYVLDRAEKHGMTERAAGLRGYG